MNKKRIIIIGSVIILLLIAAVVISIKKLPEETSQGKKEVYTYIQEDLQQVWFFSTDNDFPEWSNPMPFVNPMGNENYYSYIQVKERSYYTYEYAHKQNALTRKVVYGHTWLMHVPFDDNKTLEENHQFVYDIEHYIKFKNGMVMGYYDDSIVFVITDNNDIRWWAEAVIDYDKILLNIVKQDELKVGQTLVINTADYEDNVVRFSSFNPGDEYQSIYLEYDRGEVNFEINTDNNFGSCKRSYRTRDTVHDALGTQFYYDSIMYDPGFSNWEVTWYDPDVTKEIKITLLKTGEIPKIKFGEPLGAIKVSSEHVSGIEAFPVGNTNLYIEHPEFSNDDFYLDQTPDGDYIMFVPAGLWDVKIYPNGESLVTNYETLMVPVHSGEMTVIDIPFNISNALKAGSDDYNERGIRIGTIKEDKWKNQATFNFTLLDKSTKDIQPDLQNTTIMEGGVQTKLISVERIKTQSSVVLLLDSSGSMKGQMQATLNAAESFIKGLPDNAKIKIVDFNDKPRELIGSTKEEAIRNLSSINVGGNTALYEAISMGLNMLMQEDRPTLVVFTDGENEVKYSGGLTLGETLDLVHEAGIPLFTIGFGKGHDSGTLESLAKVSGGQYFSADDGEALKNVFAAINERLGSTFEATYERPVEASTGDVPVVSFVIDTSGSMSEYNEKFGSRIYNVKNLLRQFILGLPDEVQMQLTEFDADIKIVQALTTDKLKILRGLGRLEAGGATDITGSVLASYKTIKEIPSTKKVLIYITDAALETTRSDNNFFLELLKDIKKEEINVLWVGLGVEDEVEDFRLAAELSGGEYIVTEDIELLFESFNRVLRDVENSPQSGLSNLFISVEKTTDTGARESYSTSKLVELSPIKKSDEVIVAETINYSTGKILRQYDAYTADYISGYSVPAQDTIITKRMDVDKKSSNEAAEIIANGIVFMKRLNSVDAPPNYRFMAVTMEIKNVLEAQEVVVYPDGSSHPSSWVSGGAKGKTQFIKIPYMIPDFLSHFSLSYNNEGSFPGSMATWLVEKPLAAPGVSSITVLPDESVPGTLVFLVPDIPMEQSSLHFYDINYGHIDIPLVGEMKRKRFDVKSLPKQEPAKLTDTFALEITGCEEIEKIPGTGKEMPDVEADKGIVPGAGAVFKVVEGNFISQMQALLNMDPFERFSLRINTASGDFYIPVNPATNLLPSGFVNSRMISPGSFNKVRWLFEVPEGLKSSASEIFVDLRGEDKTATVSKGEMLPGSLNAKYKSEFLDLTVNNLVKISDGINEYYGDYIIADITIHDKKDNFSSTGIAGLFSVVSNVFFEMNTEQSRENSEGESGFYEESERIGLGNFAQSGGGSSLNRLLPSTLTEQMILGYTDDSVVYDGTNRRGIIIFQVPNEEEKEWYLYSEVFEGLKLKAASGTYNKGLLAEKVYFETDNTFAHNLNGAISRAVEQFRLNNPEKAEQLANGNIPLGEPITDKQEIPVPTICSYGSQLIKEIDSVDGMIKAMKQLRYIPSTGSYGPFNHSFSKEAMMTQGFGMEQDYANMAVEVLSRLGYHPKLKIVKLTDRGYGELRKMSGVKEIAINYLPAVSYVDNDGNYHLLVMPFMEELEVLKRLVYLDYSHYLEKNPNTIRLEINAHGYLTEKGAREHIGDISDALGGDTGGDPKLVRQWLFNDLIALDILSLDAIDVGIAKVGNIARVYLSTADGVFLGEQYIDSDKFNVKKIELIFDFTHKSNVSHIVSLDEGMEINDVFITVSINAPDLKKEAGIRLQETAERVHSQAEKPDEISALRWYGRSIISKFISSQTLHDQVIIKDMGLIAGRTEKPRVIVVTHKAGKKLKTSINLLQIHDQIHAGKEDKIKSFNILSGIYASTLEASVLPDQASGLEEIWMEAPKGTGLVFLEYLDNDIRKDLEVAGVPQDMINHFENTSNMILITDRPSIVDSQKRWAWFEINPKTYEMISVIDTLEKGAFVESTVVDTVKSSAKYAVGAFKGVETSVWSVAKFSLENDDYNEILKSAKALALGIANNFGFNMGPLGGSIGSKVSVSQAVGPVKFSFDGSAKASQNILGFTDGYKAGVEYYFETGK